jgi:hypothetical protein
MARLADVVSALARWLLGVYVRRPDPPVIPDKRRGGPSHIARGPARRPDENARAQIRDI